MSWASLLGALGRLVPSFPFSRRPPDHSNESRETRETIERARRVVATWEQRTRDTWRADGNHATRG